MKTKVLIVPTLIIVSGFVSLKYLKPDFDMYMQKRIQRDIAHESSLQAEVVANNVKALKEELVSQKEKVEFVKRYLPKEKDEARMFDSLNFLTIQTGLLASNIKIEKVEDEAMANQSTAQTFGTPTDPAMAVDPLVAAGMADGTLGLPGSPMGITAYKPPELKSYSVQLEALGGYSNIKDLLKKLTEFDRIQDIQSFTISTGDAENQEGEEESTNGTLTLSYSAHVPFQLSPLPLSGAALVSIPGLNQSTFDFAAIDVLQAKAASVPDIVLSSDGKANPFE